jgi:hypothetical protein
LFLFFVYFFSLFFYLYLYHCLMMTRDGDDDETALVSFFL